MTLSHEDHQFQRLIHRINPQSRLLRTWQLTGGVSAEVTALEIEDVDGQRQKLLARRHGAIDLSHNPHIARDEFRLLQVAHAHGLIAPKPYYVDEQCDIFPTPVIIIEYIEGDTHFAPANLAGYLLQAATQLARIHSVASSPELAFLPAQGRGFGSRPATLDASLSEGRIRDTLESAVPASHLNRPVLLHGDYWPGNLLWNNGQLVAVIDWEDAKRGDPLADVANARLEFLFAFGIDAMNDFTSQYQSMTSIDFANLPYWDLCAALGPCSRISTWGLPAETEQAMRQRHSQFVVHAAEGLGSRQAQSY